MTWQIRALYCRCISVRLSNGYIPGNADTAFGFNARSAGEDILRCIHNSRKTIALGRVSFIIQCWAPSSKRMQVRMIRSKQFFSYYCESEQDQEDLFLTTYLWNMEKQAGNSKGFLKLLVKETIDSCIGAKTPLNLSVDNCEAEDD